MNRRYGWFLPALVLAVALAAGSAEARDFVRGDVNTDGVVNIADPVTTLAHLFNGGVAYCRDAMDTNDDGMVDIADPIMNFAYLFSGGAPPEAPFGTCGPDPTADTLGCDSHDPCNLGDAIPGLTAAQFASFVHGRQMMDKNFTPAEGLGPRFNTQSCTACHNTPLTGGSAPVYRNFFLVAMGNPGAQTPAPNTPPLPSLVMPSFTNIGGQRVRMPDPAAFPGVTITASHRNAPSMFGTGLFEFVPNEAILANADPNDANADGISGRFNTDGFGNIGRFGYKLQANFIEAFIRGAANNQMGMTTNPVQGSAGVVSYNWQVGAGFDVRTTDADGIPDPEISVADFGDIINFSRFVAPPKRAPFGPEEDQGELLFTQVGCVSCHVPELSSDFGPIAPYTDLLLHDLGAGLADGISMGMPQFSTIDPFHTAGEFRTQPLWGVSMHGPWLHDGRAGSIHEAITLHGGEAETIRNTYLGLTPAEQAAVLAFLEALLMANQRKTLVCLAALFLAAFSIARAAIITDDTPVPPAGALGGPTVPLAGADLDQWIRGRKVFDRDWTLSQGLGSPDLNSDSCRSCHSVPIIGGAGLLDVNVTRFGSDNGGLGPFADLPGGQIASKNRRPDTPGREDAHLASDVFEVRQTPIMFGIGLIDSIPDSAILANEDPFDTDLDGCRGIARFVNVGVGAPEVGKFGWKAQIPTVRDFVGDGLANEIGVTVADDGRGFVLLADADAVADPEAPAVDVDDMTFFLENFAPPPRAGGTDPAIAIGEALFGTVGCATCHVPSLPGSGGPVPLFSDLLLHDIHTADFRGMGEAGGAGVGMYRTPPLWGLRMTAPYLHDGRAATILEAIEHHDDEALGARTAFESLSAGDQAALLTFLGDL